AAAFEPTATRDPDRQVVGHVGLERHAFGDRLRRVGSLAGDWPRGEIPDPVEVRALDPVIPGSREERDVRRQERVGDDERRKEHLSDGLAAQTGTAERTPPGATERPCPTQADRERTSESHVRSYPGAARVESNVDLRAGSTVRRRLRKP